MILPLILTTPLPHARLPPLPVSPSTGLSRTEPVFSELVMQIHLLAALLDLICPTTARPKCVHPTPVRALSPGQTFKKIAHPNCVHPILAREFSFDLSSQKNDDPICTRPMPPPTTILEILLVPLQLKTPLASNTGCSILTAVPEFKVDAHTGVVMDAVSFDIGTTRFVASRSGSIIHYRPHLSECGVCGSVAAPVIEPLPRYQT